MAGAREVADGRDSLEREKSYDGGSLVKCVTEEFGNWLKLAVSLLGAGGLTPPLIAGANSFSDWVCLAALLHPGAEELRKAAGAAQLPCRDVPPQTLRAQIIAAPPHETAPSAPPR